MENAISGPTVWTTGDGSGTGAAMARAFATAGVTIALTARGAEPLRTDISASLDSEEGANGIRSTALRPAEVAPPSSAAAPASTPRNWAP